MKTQLAALGLALLLGAVWMGRPDTSSRPMPLAAPPPPAARVVRPVDTPRAGQWLAAVPNGPGADAAIPAATSMALARVQGDPRTPPLHVSAVAEAGPSAAQLADRDAYRAYEQGQQARTLAAFAAATEAELPFLRADVERARASGIPPAEIAKVEEKIRELERMRRAIVEDGALPAPRR
jgi:hypothetical protein